jgi:hypothetical protein
MIKVQSPADGRTAIGAGLIIAASPQQVAIATADHLISGLRSLDAKVTVQFAARQGEWFDASVLAFKPERLDLTMIRASLPTGIDAATLAGAGAATYETLAYGADLYPMGFNSEVEWNVPPQPHKMGRPDPLKIIFPSAWVRAGSSGGALLDRCGRIVGMVTDANDTEAEAIPIELVLRAVEGWLVTGPITLKLSTSPCGATPPMSNTSTVPPALAPAPSCEVSVSSTPSDAGVFLDDRGEGTTPGRLRLSRGKVHHVRVEKDGYEPYSSQIDCESGPVEASLRSRPIILVFKGDGRCEPRLVVQIGDAKYPLTSYPYPFRIDGIPPGEQRPYWITGQLDCRAREFERQTRSSCEVVAQDGYSILVWPGGVYDITENYVGFGRCVAQLIESRR